MEEGGETKWQGCHAQFQKQKLYGEEENNFSCLTQYNDNKCRVEGRMAGGRMISSRLKDAFFCQRETKKKEDEEEREERGGEGRDGGIKTSTFFLLLLKD